MGLIDSNNLAAWTEFLAIVQMGTLAAVMVYFSKDIIAMIVGVTTDIRSRVVGNRLKNSSDHAKMGWLVLIGTLPVAILGLMFSRQIHGWFTKSTPVIIVSLIVLAALLWLAEKVARHVRTLEQFTPKDALIVGVAQAIALVPGSSRSGTTITAGLFLGF
ncbi:MAG: bacA, partial [Bacteroidetes bacterium]|nr:bacA [Bacteroidota bacterium]